MFALDCWMPVFIQAQAIIRACFYMDKYDMYIAMYTYIL